MREKPSLLIATTNQGKFDEMLHTLGDLPFSFVSLREIGYTGEVAPENDGTLFGNAAQKARFYGDACGLPTLADDTGLFLDAADGWPGVVSARIAADSTERCRAVLQKLAGMPTAARGALFSCVLALYDPRTGNVFSSVGETRGTILEVMGTEIHGFGYDPIFFVQEAGKTFAAMAMAEKNACSHRGKALSRMKYIMQNEYGGKHLVVPFAMIVRDGMVFMAKRYDPYRPAFHGKWEFPGGRMDIGETFEENLVREVQEEVGYRVEIVTRLSTIWIEYQEGNGWAYQVYLLPHICRILEGNGSIRDAEVMETRWFLPEEILEQELIGNNKRMYATLLPELKQTMQNLSVLPAGRER